MADASLSLAGYERRGAFPIGPEGFAHWVDMVERFKALSGGALPMLLMGDWNARDDWSEIADLETVWQNSSSSTILTRPASAPKEQNDYVMSRNLGAVAVNTIVVGGTQPSDHRALRATYTLP